MGRGSDICDDFDLDISTRAGGSFDFDTLESGMVVARGSIMPEEVAKGFFDDIYVDYDEIAERAFQRRLRERGPSPSSLAGKSYVLTGIFRGYEPRKLAMDILVEKGATIDGGIRRYTTALFVGDLSRTKQKNSTKKLEDAQAKGVQILGYEDLLWHIGATS